MANTEDILAELDGLLGNTSEPVTGISTTPTSSSNIGSDLLGNLDAEYAGIKRFEPTTSDIISEAMPTWETTKTVGLDTLSGLGSALKKTAKGIQYGASYLGDPYYGAAYRYGVKLEEEQAKKEAAKIDEDKRVALNMTPEQYVAYKKAETNKSYRHLGGTLSGALAGGWAGAEAGLPFALNTYGLSVPAGAIIGAFLGGGTGEVATQAAEEYAGWSPKTTAIEKARMFREAGTGAAIGEALPFGIKAGTKGTVRAIQTGRKILGPKTLEEALGTIQPAIEPAMPAAQVRSDYAQAARKTQTAGMRTTGEILNTPEALNLEQAIGLDPYKSEAYNIRLADNTKKSQEFLIGDLQKNLAKESETAMETPKLNAKGEKIPETALDHLEMGDVSHGTIGEEMGAAFNDAAKKSANELKPLYKQIEHVDTSFRSIKIPINKALEEYYPKVEGKTLKSGVITTEFSGLPSKLKSVVDDITNTRSASTSDLNKWQSQLRSMGESFARAGDDTAAAAAGKVRDELIKKIESTTAGEKWTGARGAAKERANLIENHELGKALAKENLNGETIFKKVTANESNAKNFIAIVGKDHPVVRSAKAYAYKTIEGLDTAAKKAAWIESNQKWLKHFMSENEMKALNELTDIGRGAARKSEVLNAAGGSATARRTAAAKYGLGKILERGEDTSSRIGKAAAAEKRNIARALSIGGAAIGGGLAYALGGNSINAGIGGLLGGIAAAKGKGAIARRIAAGTDLLHEAAYQIAMHPKVAGWTAPQLAKALAAKQAGQLKTAGLVGEVTGRMAQAGVYGGKLTPKKVEAVKQISSAIATPVHEKAASALEQLDKMLGGSTPTVVPTKPATPKIVGLKRVNVSETDADKHLAGKPAIIRAMAQAESANNDKAVSPKGARGRMQLMPGTAAEMGADINNPISNIDAGEAYYNKQLSKYKDERIALMAYNWGPARVEQVKKRLAKSGMDLTWENIKKHITIPTETSTYITRVLNNKKKLARG